MRLSRTPSTGQPRMQLPDRPVRTIVVCLSANAATANLRQCAITAVLDREVFTADHIAGVLPAAHPSADLGYHATVSVRGSLRLPAAPGNGTATAARATAHLAPRRVGRSPSWTRWHAGVW
jgi:hypothetical protein